MLHAYILEDDSKQREIYKHLIESYIFIEGMDIKLELATDDPQVLLAMVERNKDQRGLFFLDIEIDQNNIDGLEVAEKVRNQLNFAEIVFVTSHSEMAFLTFERKIEPLDYIIKDNGQDEIAKNLRDDVRVSYHRYQNHVFASEQHFSYQIGSRVYELPMNQLLYIATVSGQPGKIEVHHMQGMVEYPGNLNELEAKYSNLFRCHKSFLVNLEKVKCYDAKDRTVVLQDGSTCDVSFRKENVLRKALVKK
ncbi:response regulator transcription factor [Pediococcus stilesii]|uniref:Response regulator transcription factor n=1 Tax=Pediococcus stilesii TaxID=331679 RepID=A0A5R9BVI0_9LACO|nr:response regulator transcription factor [Pediococcus stilesii]TLQ04273.1 response regulator transcription factor [Pediococcus stilesii]